MLEAAESRLDVALWYWCVIPSVSDSLLRVSEEDSDSILAVFAAKTDFLLGFVDAADVCGELVTFWACLGLGVGLTGLANG